MQPGQNGHQLAGKGEASKAHPNRGIDPDEHPLAGPMAKTADGDFPRTAAQGVRQIIMETDIDGLTCQVAATAAVDRPRPPRYSHPLPHPETWVSG